MCGDFGWKHGPWSIQKDETKKFLIRTGLMFSKDWEHLCSGNNKCKGKDSIDWHSDFEALRKDGDPDILRKLKHPFKKCKNKSREGLKLM
jgi:hypothetical protein